MRVCFLHVPKAGGTTIVAVMRAHFRAQNVFQIIDSQAGERPIAHLLRERPILAGHLTVRYLSNEVLADTFVFTFLRDPMERVLSQYSYYRSLPPGQADPSVGYAQTLQLRELLERYADPGIFSAWSNLQTWIFSGCAGQELTKAEMLGRAKHNLEQLAFVGIQEELAAGAEALLQAWSGSDTFEIPQLNQSAARIHPHTLDQETGRLIAEYNSLDRELYAHARELWRKRHVPAAPAALLTDLVGTSERGSKEIEIVSVAIEGESGESFELARDEPWTLRLGIRSTTSASDLTIGIQISDSVGLTIFGTNNFLQGQQFSCGVGAFSLRITFAPLALIAGRYWLTVAAHTGIADTEKCFHWIENALEFQVVSAAPADFIGLVDLHASFGSIRADEKPPDEINLPAAAEDLGRPA